MKNETKIFFSIFHFYSPFFHSNNFPCVALVFPQFRGFPVFRASIFLFYSVIDQFFLGMVFVLCFFFYISKGGNKRERWKDGCKSGFGR